MVKNIKIYIKTIFFIFLCTSVNSKDLTGVTLDCYGENKKIKLYVFYAINFVNSNLVKHSYLFIDRSNGPNDEFVEKKNDTYKYEVDEHQIIIRSINEQNGISFFQLIYRKTLDTEGGASVMIDAKCKIVDINKNDPFKKIENYKIPIKKEPKKNIL